MLSCAESLDNPKTLQLSFEYLEDNWSAEGVQIFKDSSERKATISQHFGMGLFLRNTWIRNHDQSEQIQKYFDGLGIYHPDDISSIILTSYHRHLNNKPLKLEQQADFYKRFWAEEEACDQMQEDRAKTYLEQFQIGDTLLVKLPLDDKKDALNYACYEEWDAEVRASLKIQGKLIEVLEKDNIDQSEFKVQVISKTIPDATIYGKTIFPNDTLTMRVKSSWKLYSISDLDNIEE